MRQRQTDRHQSTVIVFPKYAFMLPPLRMLWLPPFPPLLLTLWGSFINIVKHHFKGEEERMALLAAVFFFFF